MNYPKKRPIHKRSYLLLEVLISLALVTICLLPMLKPLAVMSRQAIQSKNHFELERQAKLAFNEFKIELFENKIPWETLEKGNKDISIIDKYDRKEPAERYLLLEVKINQDFSYPLLVKKSLQ